jgi:2-phospho-L-lactate/phosphoenolpyruvate guanylyltransferase
MKLWLIIPVKPLDEAKSRLAPVLSPDERAALMEAGLDHVLACARAVGFFTGVLVISRDRAIRARATAAGATALWERGYTLNEALGQARDFASRQQADAILVLPADLPLLTVQDLHALYRLAQQQPGVLLAPSRDGGTGALLLRPANAIPFAFGSDSFRYHCALAERQSLPCQVYESPTLAFDVDTPADWAELQQVR